jgi:hypothetical protein
MGMFDVFWSMIARKQRNLAGTRAALFATTSRVRIEIECAAARPGRAIGEQFGLKRDAVRRHWQNHLSGTRKAGLICGPLKIQRLAEKSAEEDRSLLGILRSELFHFIFGRESAWADI